MDLVFAGTPRFAAIALQALIEAGHRVRLVLTQPDRAAGRGRRLEAPPVKRFAQDHGLAVMQPSSLQDPNVVRALAACAPEAIVVAAYGLLVPKTILELPARGCINIHASLLPRWRGAAPIQRALMAGDAETGITIMQMDEGLDTGPILLQQAVPISDEDTAGSLHDRLAELGSSLIVEALGCSTTPRAQNSEGATYAAKLSRDDSRIDWSQSAAAIERKLRALDPAPGAYAACGDGVLKIWRARVERGRSSPPGTILAVDGSGILVSCGEGALRITELQRPGGRRVPAAAYLAGHTLAPGTRFG
jgi:methionyl-tRNA formyltransferase